jgi:hypothetical protein
MQHYLKVPASFGAAPAAVALRQACYPHVSLGADVLLASNRTSSSDFRHRSRGIDTNKITNFFGKVV